MNERLEGFVDVGLSAKTEGSWARVPRRRAEGEGSGVRQTVVRATDAQGRDWRACGTKVGRKADRGHAIDTAHESRPSSSSERQL